MEKKYYVLLYGPNDFFGHRQRTAVITKRVYRLIDPSKSVRAVFRAVCAWGGRAAAGVFVTKAVAATFKFPPQIYMTVSVKKAKRLVIHVVIQCE